MKKIIITLGLFIYCSLNIFSQTSDYIVLTSVSDTSDDYYHAAKILATYRNAQILNFNPANVNLLLPTLYNLAPRYIAVVIKPNELDINFVREFLMMSTKVDTDPFSDFSYGYITGATGQDAIYFVNNIIYAESQNIQDFPLNVGGYVATSLNLVYNGNDGYMALLNPPHSSCIWLETSDSGSGEAFFMANSGNMENNKILDIGHNGDPHMLWLFEGGNSTPNPPVWDYDPAKIEDTAYARAGLTSYDIGTLYLYPAVAFNGACHSGETKRVMVEGDIAATFGDTQGLVKFYTMSDTFSFALSILKTGITGYFAPCGANNANDQREEVYNAFLYQEPLGDIHKRTNDGVVMGFLGNRPNLRIYTENESTWDPDILPSGSFDPSEWPSASSMLGGKANRIYFGDPLFDPYHHNHSESLNITKAILDSNDATTLDINVSMNKPDGFWPVWDKFHFGHTRVYIPVELPGYCGEITSFTVLDSSGPYDLVIHAVEHFDGKTILHIEVDIPNDMYDPVNYNIKFRISFVNTGTDDINGVTQKITVYPNPAKDNITFIFQGLIPGNNTLLIYNANGQLVRKIEGFNSNVLKIDTQEFTSGLYYFQLKNDKVISGIGKFIIE